MSQDLVTETAFIYQRENVKQKHIFFTCYKCIYYSGFLEQSLVVLKIKNLLHVTPLTLFKRLPQTGGKNKDVISILFDVNVFTRSMTTSKILAEQDQCNDSHT